MIFVQFVFQPYRSSVFFGLFFYIGSSYLNSVFTNSYTNSQCPVVVCSSSLRMVPRVRKTYQISIPNPLSPPGLTQPARHSFFSRCLPDGKPVNFFLQVAVQAVHLVRHRVDRDHVLRFRRVRKARHCHHSQEWGFAAPSFPRNHDDQARV